MGKIVKFCSSCDEGFAEKFSFCPNCGGQLQAFEMNPVVAETKPVAEPPQFVAPIVETPKIVEEPKEEVFNETKFEPAETEVYSFETAPLENSFIEKKVEEKSKSKNGEIVAEPKTPIVEEPKVTVSKTKSEKTVVAAAPTVVNTGYQTFVEGASTNSSRKDTYSNANNEGDFKVTVIEEKSKQKNILLLASLAFMTVLLSVSFIYSLFNKDFGVGAIETGDYRALVPEIEPVPIESEPPPKEEKKDDGGGGGGGGRDEKTPVQDGRLATQVDKPFIAPTKTITQVTNPDIKIQAATQGNIQRPIENKPYGLPGGTGQNSDGMGSGGGMGSGRGTGMGNGVGTGEGNGIGSGSGNGNGDGIGNGRGSGGPGSPPPPPPARPVGVTVARKIISKPQARYTDAARQNSVQGTVSVRVTFLASGQIGSVVAVNGLPYGLTEQALAAARSIRFEPAKKDGVPITTQATIQYSFTIY